MMMEYQGLFREDLFRRLNVIRIRLPALRERREDIPLLARYFLQKSAKVLNVETKRFAEPALKYLAAQDFPGNVRQLENVCHWLTVMAPAQVVEPKDLPPELLVAPAAPRPPLPALAAEAWTDGGTEAAPAVAPVPSVPATGAWLEDLEREVRTLLDAGVPDVWDALTRKFEAQLIHTALDITRGRRIEAAHKLGIGRNTITRKIQELGLDD